MNASNAIEIMSSASAPKKGSRLISVTNLDYPVRAISMKKFTITIVALVAIAVTASLPGAQPVFASSQLKLSDIYSNSQVTKVYIALAQASEKSLNSWSTLKTYVPATVRFEQEGKSSSDITVGMRLKGTTSLQPLDGKPSIKLKFNWGDSLSTQRFLGLKNMTLNAMTQDSSYLHEFAAYKLYNAMGVVAPATGWAEVFVNGKPKGIYVNVETPDDIFLSKRFKDQSQHLYEAQAWADLKQGNNDGDKTSGAFTLDEGWKNNPNKNDLANLISKANIASGSAWYKALDSVVDKKSLLKMFAVDNLTGNWDSYSGPIINNYFLRSNTKNKFTFIPWGADQTFGENRESVEKFDTYFFPMDAAEAGYPWVQANFKKDAIERGLLFKKCLAYKPCFTDYLKELRNASAKANSIKLTSQMSAVSALLSNWSDDYVQTEQRRTINFFKKQQNKVSALMAKYKIK